MLCACVCRSAAEAEDADVGAGAATSVSAQRTKRMNSNNSRQPMMTNDLLPTGDRVIGHGVSTNDLLPTGEAQLHQLEQHSQYFTVFVWKNTPGI